MGKAYNLPQCLAIEDYRQCCDMVVNEAKNNDTVVAVYLMGGEWCLGVSDLDIIMVYKDKSIVKPVRSIWGLSGKADFILMHRHLSFFEKDFKDIYYIYPKKTTNLRLLWGRDVDPKDPIEKLSTEGIKSLGAFILFNILINKLLLFPEMQKKDLNVRKTIGELYSLRYTFDIIRTISDKTIGNVFTAKIQEFRNQWFNVSIENNLIQLSQLLAEGIDLVLESVNILDEYLVANGFKFEDSDNAMFLNKKFHITFDNKWGKDNFLDNFHKRMISKNISLTSKKIKNYSLLLPSSFIYFFWAYAMGEGEFSKSIKSHFHARLSAKISTPEIVNNHIEAMNKSFDSSVSTNGSFKTPFSFGFSLSKKNKTKVWLFEKLLHIMRRIGI